MISRRRTTSWRGGGSSIAPLGLARRRRARGWPDRRHGTERGARGDDHARPRSAGPPCGARRRVPGVCRGGVPPIRDVSPGDGRRDLHELDLRVPAVLRPARPRGRGNRRGLRRAATGHLRLGRAGADRRRAALVAERAGRPHPHRRRDRRSAAPRRPGVAAPRRRPRPGRACRAHALRRPRRGRGARLPSVRAAAPRDLCRCSRARCCWPRSSASAAASWSMPRRTGSWTRAGRRWPGRSCPPCSAGSTSRSGFCPAPWSCSSSPRRPFRR